MTKSIEHIWMEGLLAQEYFLQNANIHTCITYTCTDLAVNGVSLVLLQLFMDLLHIKVRLQRGRYILTTALQQ